MKIKTLYNQDDDYPNSLRNIFEAPEKIYITGEWRKNSTKLGVIGTRKISPYGRQILQQFLGELKGYDVGIISGLALGVDGLAHTEALKNSLYTAAVIPSSLTNIYPRTHQKLAQDILASGGALISETTTDENPRRYDFHKRNRIIAGLCDYLLVVEADVKSGTSITVNFALEAGINVLSVPGPIFSPVSRGTNNYIKHGAQIICSPQDLLHALGLDSKEKSHSLYNEHEKLVYEYIKNQSGDLLTMPAELNIDMRKLNQILTEFELRDIIFIENAKAYIR